MLGRLDEGGKMDLGLTGAEGTLAMSTMHSYFEEDKTYHGLRAPRARGNAGTKGVIE